MASYARLRTRYLFVLAQHSQGRGCDFLWIALADGGHDLNVPTQSSWRERDFVRGAGPYLAEFPPRD